MLSRPRHRVSYDVLDEYPCVYMAQNVLDVSDASVCVHDELEPRRRLKVVEFVVAGRVTDEALLGADDRESRDEGFEGEYHSVHKLELFFSRNSGFFLPRPLLVVKTGAVSVEYVEVINRHLSFAEKWVGLLSLNDAHREVLHACAVLSILFWLPHAHTWWSSKRGK